MFWKVKFKATLMFYKSFIIKQKFSKTIQSKVCGILKISTILRIFTVVFAQVLGVDSEFCNVEALITGIVDNWPDQLLRHRRKFTGRLFRNHAKCRFHMCGL
jgi:Sodium:neurotransmitter symporter family